MATKKKKKGKDRSKPRHDPEKWACTSMLLTVEQRKALDAIAKAQKRSLGFVIRDIIDAGLAAAARTTTS